MSTKSVVRGQVVTKDAERYLRRLCKHWTHKFTIAFSSTVGHIQFFEHSLVDLRAEEGILRVQVTSVDHDEARKIAQIVEDHVVRFGHNETLEFTWEEPVSEKVS